MSFSDMPIFKAFGHKLAWLTKRQSVLSENVANANTPNFAAKDLKELDFANLLRVDNQPKLRMASTSDNHIGGLREPRNPKMQTKQNPYEVSPTGNSVVLEEQAIQLADNAMKYQEMTNLYRKQIAMLKTVLGRTSG